MFVRFKVILRNSLWPGSWSLGSFDKSMQKSRCVSCLSSLCLKRILHGQGDVYMPWVLLCKSKVVRLVRPSYVVGCRKNVQEVRQRDSRLHTHKSISAPWRRLHLDSGNCVLTSKKVQNMCGDCVTVELQLLHLWPLICAIRLCVQCLTCNLYSLPSVDAHIKGPHMRFRKLVHLGKYDGQRVSKCLCDNSTRSPSSELEFSPAAVT